MSEINFSKIGFKCGIEIHCQINSRRKLFSKAISNLVENDKLNKSILRKLRFSSGENNLIDTSAIFEFKKNKTNKYLYNDFIATLYEIDEIPPRKINDEAFLEVLKISKHLNLNFFNKIQIMRKLIVDGSCPSGFQRTAILGICGELKLSNKNVKINSINIEEDSSRIIEKNDIENIYSLDRLGIPLIEITTDASMKNLFEVKECATKLGEILRSYNTKRGIGTIRQDLNVSIENGARVEIKGAQDLILIEKIVENEITRQQKLIEFIKLSKEKNITGKNIWDKKIYDVTKIFEKTGANIIKKNLEKKENGVYCIKLNNFKNMLGFEIQKDFRIATEISNKNKLLFSKIKGLIHFDEIEKYDFSQGELDNLKKEIQLKDNDNFIILVEEKKVCQNSFNYIFKVIQKLIKKVNSEVRQVIQKDFRTKYLREIGSQSRMYPETDLEIIDLEDKFIESIELNELHSKKVLELSKKYNLEENKIEEFLEKFSKEKIIELFEIAENNSKKVYDIIFTIPKDIKSREKTDAIDFRFDLIKEILKTQRKNNFSQKIIRDIFLSLYKDKIKDCINLEEYIKNKKLVDEINLEEIQRISKEIIEKNKNLPFGAIMGILMRQFENKVDGKILSDILKKNLK